MDKNMKRKIITFFINNPEAFGRFCTQLLEGHPRWHNIPLSSKDACEIYQAMREIFPGRKEN